MWKATGKTTTLSLFLDSFFPETEILETGEVYSHLKEEALDRIKWRNRFGRDCGPVV
jgi:hypothetical protein